ncbi:hypothetical protein ColTof4_01523 [Colletotrichum tofieldiae]|uniref:Uncharacterized protein n=1 Tax=Colletotrichum tofieldiae TaxID=708197 RepID=A0A166YVF3_9PEZI|nr:hypothetical protein CT0861_04104 [Colletotrichum tofieldiae]GKT62859.1 hypothetical protein ColTof3_10198 [Colletotrichum tofieldiae]GKT69100.1 hypothetical protein ColTof4_01523 [Colletotrichum tofieldiae]GKT96608.1 hypothetical protein Ct61P_14458 [Colletotrichum tofieldiae]
MSSKPGVKGQDISTNVPGLNTGSSSTHRYNNLTELENQLDQDAQFTLEDLLVAFSSSSLTQKSHPSRTPTTAMSSSRSGRSGGSSSHHRSSKSGKKPRAVQRSIQQLIESLETHRVNTLTELCRIERVAATCENEEDALAFQGPMTSAWDYYVNSNQFLTELRGLTRSYPLCSDILYDAHVRVRNDPNSNKSWNLAWLCLMKIQEDDLVSGYAALEAAKPEMWGGREPSPEEAAQLGACFQYEWNKAVDTMLRHWSIPPTWY